MKNHQKFLSFNGKNIVFLNVDGTYWIALKPILEGLNMDADSSIKRTQRDPFLGGYTSKITVQVEHNGVIQGRNMTCLPEKYIYGWICFLRSDNQELNQYKETCYNLLYEHFHGTITNRKELLLERNDLDKQIHKLKAEMREQDENFKLLQELQNKRKVVSTRLNSQDKTLVQQGSLFEEGGES